MSLSKKINFILVLCISIQSFSQDKVQELDSIVINSSRISLPFKKNSRTITIIKAKDIKNSAATNVADLLQQVTGVDIRRRGTGGGQSDLYIRGGGFDQTLLFNLFLVTILMAPVNAFCPKILAAGPLIISILSITSIGKAAFMV